MLRMGMYIDYGIYNKQKVYTPIVDYNYIAESSILLSYDGYLNRSLGCYQMDISNYIQALMLAAVANTDADGKVDLTKFAAGNTTDTSGDYVNMRRIYIGPDASQLYGMKRQALYGMYGDGAKVPIKLELTYTIVK
jgi:hypothetical protein